MTKYIAVMPASQLGNLKRYLLMFDELALVNIEGQQIEPHLEADVEWLHDRGVVSPLIRANVKRGTLNARREGDAGPGITMSVVGIEVHVPAQGKLPSIHDRYFISEDAAVRIETGEVTRRGIGPVCRQLADRLNSWEPIARAISLAPVDENVQWNDVQATPGDVLRVLINEMPQPSDDTALDRILEFRSDTDSKNKIIAFRHWIQNLIAQKISAREAIEEMEFLKMQYAEHMCLHGMKVNTGFCETLVTTAFGMAENLVKLKWSEFGKVPFILKHRKIELLEAEAKAPGREISYLIHAARELR
jgi:hypothetical protein